MSSEQIRVYGSVPFGELRDMSPFVLKAEDHLRLAGLGYEKRVGDLRKAPRGKIPFIEHEGTRTTDSAQIIRYLADAGLADLDAGLDAEQRAERSALIALLELELYFIISWFRYQHGWELYRVCGAHYFRELGIPSFLTPLALNVVRRKFLRAIHDQGAGRREIQENNDRLAEIFDALEQFKSRHDGPFWFGERPTSVDATAHAFVAATVVPEFDFGHDKLLQGRERLHAWFDHVHAKLG